MVADRWPLQNHVSADSGRKVVTIYAQGREVTITTDLTTVRDALAKANVQVAADDIVEPGLNTVVPDGYFNVNVYSAQPYRVIDGARTILVRSALSSPRLIAGNAGVELYPQDSVALQPVTNVAEAGTVGQDIVITRAQATNVVIDGQQLVLRSQKSTVGGLLADNGITVSDSDSVQPSVDTKITPGMNIVVARVRVNVETVDEVITAPVQQQSDATQPRGYKKVQTEGQDGLRRVTYIVTYHNGQPTTRQEVKRQDITVAQPRIELVGTKVLYANDAIQLGYDMASARGWTGGQWDALYKLWMKESGWNPNSINNGSGACGIPQAYPCSKITDRSAAGQITWGLNYIKGRYGNPAAAWAHWLAYGSY